MKPETQALLRNFAVHTWGEFTIYRMDDREIVYNERRDRAFARNQERTHDGTLEDCVQWLVGKPS